MKNLLLIVALSVFTITSKAEYRVPVRAPLCNQKVYVTSNGPFHYMDDWGRHSAEFSGDYECESIKEVAGVISVKMPGLHYPVPYGYDRADGTLIINFYPNNKAVLVDHIDTWICRGTPHVCELNDTIQLAALTCNSDDTSCVTTKAKTPITFNFKW